MYHVSCEPLRIFWNDDTTCPTRVPRVLSTTGWKARNPALSRQHAWHSCRAGCTVISENPQELATTWYMCLYSPTVQATRVIYWFMRTLMIDWKNLARESAFNQCVSWATIPTVKVASMGSGKLRAFTRASSKITFPSPLELYSSIFKDEFRLC